MNWNVKDRTLLWFASPVNGPSMKCIYVTFFLLFLCYYFRAHESSQLHLNFSVRKNNLLLLWEWCGEWGHLTGLPSPLFDVWLDNKTLDRNLTQIIYLSYLQFRACLRDLQSVALNLSILNVRNGKWKCFSVSNKNLTENMNQ